ncbi:M20/M25/M40 family metallo-hydrolase [Cytophagaceae bacterium ABcell3]|nr:M20/M25/M40 family metallo-hydrolase [Cytophagaceae bacterium ABcell3]
MIAYTNKIPFVIACMLFLFPWNTYAQGQDEIPEYATVLSKFIQYPSETYKEKEAALFLKDFCEQKGFVTEVLIDEDTAYNFAASIYPLSSGKPNIIFFSHIDVVPPGDLSAWKFPPYSGTIHDGLVWGRGAIDCKGMTISQLFSMINIKEWADTLDLPFNVTLLPVTGEETDGFTGAKPISEQFVGKLNPVVMLGEGGGGLKGVIKSQPEKPVFGISTIEKTKLTLNLTMNMKASGHGSVTPDEYAGKEMIFALQRLLKEEPEIKFSPLNAKGLKKLGKYEKGLKGFVQRNATFFCFRPLIKKEIRKDPELMSFFTNTITLTDIHVPEPEHNQVIQEIRATLDCRLMPGTNPNAFIRQIKRSLKDSRIEVETLYEIEAIPQIDAPDLFGNLAEAIEEVYPDALVVEMLFPATTDNNFFRAKNIPVMGLFPAICEQDELNSIHNVNERIQIRSMSDAIEVYTNFAENMMFKEEEKKRRRLLKRIRNKED